MSRPRDGLQSHFEGYPAYGALHPVIPNQQLREFLFDQTRIADLFFVNRLAGVEVDPVVFDDVDGSSRSPLAISSDVREYVAEGYNPNKFYRMFNPDTLGVTVLDMDGSSKAAKRARQVWEKQDYGAVEQEAVNEIGRTMPNIVPKLSFNGARGVGGRLPNVPDTEIRQKLALLPNQMEFRETQSLLEKESKIIEGAIRRRLKQHLGPWDYMAHLTHMVFRREAHPSDIEKITETTSSYLGKFPLTVRLDDLEIRSKSTR